jgi:hypothetical protein
MLQSKVNKSVAPWTKGLSANEARVALPAKFVHLVWIIHITIHEHFGLAHNLNISLLNNLFQLCSTL